MMRILNSYALTLVVYDDDDDVEERKKENWQQFMERIIIFRDRTNMVTFWNIYKVSAVSAREKSKFN